MLAFFGGDSFSPSEESNRLQGSQMVDVQSKVGFTASMLGNHDFDFGVDIVRERLHQAKLEGFRYILSNVVETHHQKPFQHVLPYEIYERNGLKIGVFGLLTRDTSASTKNFEQGGIEFLDEVYVARQTTQILRAMGAQYIIALTHLTVEEDRDLAAQVRGINLILGGHDHKKRLEKVGSTYIMKMAANLESVGIVEVPLDFDVAGRSKVSGRYRPIFYDVKLDETIPDDPVALDAVVQYETMFEGADSEIVIGETKTELDVTPDTMKSGESAFGSFIADAYREALDADIALANGGGIRSEFVFNPGKITRGDLKEFLPYNDPIVKVEMSGKALKQALEKTLMANNPDERRFFQISGFEVTFDLRKPSGKRILEMTRNGKLIEESDVFSCVIDIYLLNGGDGHHYFKGLKVLDRDSMPGKVDVVEQKIKTVGVIAPTLADPSMRRIRPANCSHLVKKTDRKVGKPVPHVPAKFLDLFS